MTSRKRKNSPVETTPYDALAELYQALFDRATEGIFIADGQGRFIEVNPCGCEMVGYTHAEILNLSWQDMIPPQELARNPLRLEDLRAGKTVFNERWLRCKDGRLLPVEINTRLLSGGNLLGMVRDISERKHLEVQLLEGQERFRLLSESSLTGIYLIQEDRFRYVNPAMAKMFGYTVEELVDRRSPLDLVHPDDRQLVAENVRRRIEDEVEEIRYNFRGLRKDGLIVHIEVHGRRIKYKGTMGVLGTLVDITERKQTEAALHRLNRELRALNRCNETLLRAVDEQVLLNDVCRIVCDEAGYRMAWVGYAEYDEAKTVRPVAWAGVEDGYLTTANITWADTEWGRGPFGTAIRTGASDCIQDFTIDPKAVPWRENALLRGYHSALVLPLKNENNGTFGALCIYSTEPNVFTPNEIRLMEELSANLAFGITTLRIRTEHKKAETQVQASEQLFRTLVENSPDLIARYDREFRRVYVNPAIQKLFPKPADAMLHQTPADESPLYAPQVYLDQLRQVVETGTERTVEMLLGTSQSEVDWGHVRFVPEFGPDGQVASVLSIGRNINEVKAKERRFRTLADNFPDFVIRFDRDGRLAYVNPALEKAFGLPAAAFIGKTLPELPQYHGSEQNEVLLALLHRAFDEGVSNNAEICWDTQIGQRIFEIRHVPEKDAAGNVVTVLGIAHDITERKQAEEALREKTDELDRFFTVALDLLCIADTDGYFRRLNPQWEVVLGYSLSELEGRRFLDLVHPDDQVSTLATLDKLAAQKTVFDFVNRYRCQDGSYRWIEWRTYPAGHLIYAAARDITERKRVEEALRESEFFLRKSQSVAHIGSYYFDTRIGQWISSPALDKIFGIDDRFLKDIDGWIGLIHPKHQDEMLQYLTHYVLAEHNRFDKEYQIIRYNDQQERWVHGLGELEFDENGNAIKMIGTIQDITERKQAEEALQFTRFTVESVADAVYWINPEARIIGVNKAACDLLSYTKDELCRLSLADIDPGFSMDQWPQAWKHIRTTGRDTIESVHRTKTGRLIPVEIVANFIKFGGQELDCAVVRDITERKQVEAQLRTSEARYRALVQSQLDLVSRYLPDTTLTFVNDAYCQFYGKKREDLIGLSFLTMVAPEFHEVTLKETESLVKEPRSIAGEYLNYTWDGRACWMHWIIQSIVDENGQVIELQATGRDITPLKRAEEEIRELNKELERRVIERTAQLEAANRELEAFAYSVSHDLRAPLRHIDGFLELLERRIAPTLDERSQHYISTISASAKHMGTLIDDLLSFSRMGRSEMSKNSVELTGLVKEVIQQLELETLGRTVRWHIADLPSVSGDQAMLRMVLVNLLSNALKFTRGCPQAEIEIGYQPGQGNETIFFVRDNGAGFDMAYADKLFGVFQRLHRIDEFEGTGIGLANVRRIINRHGGRVWAEGKVDQGATFYFSLPQTILEGH